MYSARRSNRLLWTVCVLVATIPALSGTAEPTERPTAKQAVAADETAARFLPSGRIRKLHLVRPDLLPYPIAYEIVC